MAYTLPAGFATELEAETCRPLLLYELYLDAATLFYSSQVFTWPVAGQAYSALAVKCSPIVHELRAKVPTVRLTFANANNALRDQIEPADLISGKRLIIRQVLKDSNEAAIAGSLVVFEGLMKRPRRVNQSTFEITAFMMPQGIETTCPGRSTTYDCRWVFKDGVNCNYAGGSTVCKRTYGASGDAAGAETCHGYSRTHEYGGFRGEDTTQASAQYVNDFGVARPRNDRLDGLGIGGRPNTPILSGPVYKIELDRSIADSQVAVPIIYGQVRTGGVLVESTYNAWGDGAEIKADFYVLSEGEIDSVVRWWDGPEIGEPIYGGAGYKLLGMYYRVGTIGLDDDETDGEYLATPSVAERAQNRDTLSFAADPLSMTAYAMFINRRDTEFEQVSQPKFEVKGIKAQKYTSSATPTTDGAAAFSRNPIWQALDLCKSKRYGGGRTLTIGTTSSNTDFDLITIKAAADYCDVVVPGAVATLTANHAGSVNYRVDNARDFEVGMPVVFFDGGSNADTVVQVGNTFIQLETSRAQSIGDTITAQVPRFTCDIILDRQATLWANLSQILATCNGYPMLDEEGRIGFQVEQTGSSVATFADSGAAAGYGIIKDSFEWLTDADEREINQVILSYRHADGDDETHDEIDFTDFDAKGLTSALVRVQGCNNRDQAHRLAKLKLSRSIDYETGARFIVGPAGQQLEVGDRITVTHAVPNWSSDDKRVTKLERFGLGDGKETLVRVTVEDYITAPYADTRPEDRPGFNTNEPTIVLTNDTDGGGRIVLTWSVTGSAMPVIGFTVHKSDATFGGVNPGPGTMVGGTITTRRSYVYTPLDAEIGTDLFFVVKARLRRAVVSSNELTINPSTVDPTDELANIDNMVYSGDFDEPRDWEGVGGDFDIATGLSGTSGSSTQLLPSSASGTWGVTANTFDGDDATVGTETVTTGEGTQSITYSFAAATKTGYARVRMASGGQRGRLICYYTLNDSDYVRFGTAAEYADNFQSIVFNGQVMANFKIRVTGRSGLSGSPPTPVDVAHSIYSVSFEETATIVAPYALIADNICTLVPSSADTDVVTKIVDNATGTEYTAATFVDADFTADWQLHRVFWTATADLDGDLSIRIEAGDTFVLRPFPGIEPNQTEVAVISGERLRTQFKVREPDSTSRQIDQIEIKPADRGQGYAPSSGERSNSYYGDQGTGRPVGFARGTQPDGEVRISQVTGDTK